MSDCAQIPYHYHTPVMLQEVMNGLNISPNGIYADLTFGGGGHSRELLKHLSGKGHLYAFDQDTDTLEGTPDDARFTFVHSNFCYVEQWMRYYGVEGLDGIMADLGVSSHHLDDAGRGFTFRQNAPLDMRMNRQARCSAQEVVNEYTEEQLANIFRFYGELKQSKKLSNAIVRARAAESIKTTGQLAEIVLPYTDRSREKKDLARVFQALRIEVNGEMKALRQMLEAVPRLLRPGGRLVVLTYHSLEDRMVKNIMRSGNVEGRIEQDVYGRIASPLCAVGKMQVPTEREQNENPRSRSAKLRIAERVSD